MKVDRICVRAKPAKNHPEYKEWETAKILILFVASDRDQPINLAKKMLRIERWELLEIELCDRLIESRVRRLGGDVLEAFETAVATGSTIRIFPEHFAPGRGGIPAILPMRITESFMDLVVQDIGGERILTDDENQVVDYMIGDWLFELKDLQEEGLYQPERQQKLANLFSRFAEAELPVQITPSVLNESELQEFFNIISGPIKPQVKKASKQIRSTRGLLNRDDLSGGIIYLNTGYGSFAPEEFGPLVERYVHKDTTQIDAIFCIALWNETNGFDSYVFYRLYPEKPTIPVLSQLQDAFAYRFKEVMTQLVLGTLPANSILSEPLKPVCFSFNGIDFVWQPGLVPLKLGET